VAFCVLTGDYRGKTYGPFEESLEIIDELQAQLIGPVYGVLGNHDSIRMAPSMEAIGICMLFNECEQIVRDGQCIFLAGVDDPHFYRADVIEKASAQIPSDAFSILLAHTPEVYDRAMNARFYLVLCGHTHGGQLCLSVFFGAGLGTVDSARVIDAQGRCAEADIYIVLPKDWRGDAILKDIHANMPGLKEAVWDFEPDGPKVYAPRNNSVAKAVIELMRTRDPGQTPLSYIRAQLSLIYKQFSRMKEDLAKAGSNLATALYALGVSYKVEGRGSATKGYLVKAA
jgi:hypothetical protein